MISATEAKKNWIIANIIIGFFLTANESIWTCKAQNIDPDIIQISPILIFSITKFPVGIASKTEPITHIKIANHNEKCGIEPKKIPIIGTIITYRLVKKPALVAVVVTRPICWNNAAIPSIRPRLIP